MSPLSLVLKAQLRVESIHVTSPTNVLLETLQEFYNIANFPNVRGAADYTHVQVTTSSAHAPKYFAANFES